MGLRLDGDVYSLLQFHFHAPSEHTIDGDHSDMEMHLVHQADVQRILAAFEDTEAAIQSLNYMKQSFSLRIAVRTAST